MRGISRSCLALALWIVFARPARLCAAGNPFIQVLVGPNELAKADSIERVFRARSELAAPAGMPWFTVDTGSVPIIITVSHATRTYRKGRPRSSDRGTGTLAALLRNLTGATVLSTLWASPCDPNETDSCAFKDTLASLLMRIRPVLVLDLHTSHSARPYDVDFGTMKGASIRANEALLAELSGILSMHGLTCQSRDFFSAGEQKTVTRFVQARGFQCIQVEINSTWMAAIGSEIEKHRFAQVTNGLVSFVRSVGSGGKPAIAPSWLRSGEASVDDAQRAVTKSMDGE